MQYNVNNPAVKRILREVKEMEAEPSDQYHANPLEDNIFEWHFTIRGPKDTEFAGGLYHGRILLPPEYPFKPPNIVLLNESGRFEVGTKICLSISSYHPEHWQPSWSIRTVLVALISFMPTKGDGAIGAIDMPAKDRKIIAIKTPNYFCDKCGKRMCDILSPQEIGSQSQTETTSESNTTTTTTTTTSSNNETNDETNDESNEKKDTNETNETNEIKEKKEKNETNETQLSPSIESPVVSPSISSPSVSSVPSPSISSVPSSPVSSSSSSSFVSAPAPVTPQPAAVVQQNNNNNNNNNNNAPAPQFVQQQQQQQQQQQNVQQQSDIMGLDYAIMAIVIALIGLLIKKFYGL